MHEDALVPGVPSTARTYGGNYAWVGAPYKLEVRPGFSPLQWLNDLTKRLLVMGDLVLEADGSFRRPADLAPLSPKGGVELRWRWESQHLRIVIDFFKDGELLPWRWDELVPSRDLRFPSVVPDWKGTGHVGRRSFEFALLSATAEAEEPSKKQWWKKPWWELMEITQHSPPVTIPHGSCKLGPSPVCDQEARMDFARAFLADTDPRLFLVAPCLAELRPLHPLVGTTCNNSAENLSRRAVDDAVVQFGELLRSALAAAQDPRELPGPTTVDRIVAHLGTGTGLRFAAALGLPSVFLQPAHAVVALAPAGRHWELRVATFGYVAERPEAVWGDGLGKGRPLLARIISQDLSPAPEEEAEQLLHYSLRAVPSSSVIDCMAQDAGVMRVAGKSAEWSQLLGAM